LYDNNVGIWKTYDYNFRAAIIKNIFGNEMYGRLAVNYRYLVIWQNPVSVGFQKLPTSASLFVTYTFILHMVSKQFSKHSGCLTIYTVQQHHINRKLSRWFHSTTTTVPPGRLCNSSCSSGYMTILLLGYQQICSTLPKSVMRFWLLDQYYWHASLKHSVNH